jgi:hypothetical protein
MYCDSCEVGTEFIYVMWKKIDRLCSLVVRIPSYTKEMCFLWGTNWIYICYVEESRPLLWYSNQSYWLQIQRSGFDSRRYQIFWEVVGLERGPLILMSTIVELLERKSSGSGLENREYCLRVPSRLSRGAFYPQKLALASATSCGRSVGIVCSLAQATEFFNLRTDTFFFILLVFSLSCVARSTVCLYMAKPCRCQICRLVWWLLRDT